MASTNATFCATIVRATSSAAARVCEQRREPGAFAGRQTWGRLSLPTFFGEAKKVGCRRATPGSIVNPTPNIVPLAVKEGWIKSLAGVSLSFMKITFYAEGVKQFSKTGKVLFTHFGLSGPLILNSAKKVGDLLHKGEVTARIDAFPEVRYSY